MTKKINLILEKTLKKINPEEKQIGVIKNKLKSFLERLNKKIKKEKIQAEIFVGGSFAKRTVIKKGIYDVDLFVRFSKKYSDKELSKLLNKILKGFRNVKLVHGSRDYYRIKINNSFLLELIPVLKISKPSEAKNITDMSYSHVKYVKKKTKNKKILDEIKLVKAFCYAKGVYGAESYIKGFSGYSLELLIIYYGSFLKFLKAISKIKEEKLIIDIEKKYKNKREILLDLNESKLESPIILIDPTHKYRNALAALSKESLISFQKDVKKFLKSGSEKDFEIKKINIKSVKENSKKKGFEFIALEIKTKKQAGDIAGSKLIKFYNHLAKEISKYFEMKKKGFNYNNKKSTRCFFVVKKKKEIILSGPLLNDKKNLEKFKSKHKNNFVKKNRVYSQEKINFSLKQFLKNWKVKNKRKIKEMDVSGMKLI